MAWEEQEREKVKEKILISIFALLSCSIATATDKASIIKSFEMDTQISLTPLKDHERFYLALKSNIFLYIDYYHLKDAEKLLGSFSKEVDPPVRKIPTPKLNSFGIKTRQKIHYYNLEKDEVSTFEVKESSEVQLIESPYDGAFYTNASLLLAPFSESTDINSQDLTTFDSVAFVGDSYKLKKGKMHKFKWEDVKTDSTQFANLDRDFFIKNSLPANYKNVIRSVSINENVSFYEISNNLDRNRITYAINKDGVTWGLSRRGTNSKSGRILGFGDNIEGASFTLIVERYPNYYLNVFYSDKVEVFEVWKY